MKKLLIVLLSVAVLFTFMPAAAFADTYGAKDDQHVVAGAEKAPAINAAERSRIQAAPSYDSDEDGSWDYHSGGWMFLVNGEGYATGWTVIDDYCFYFDPSTSVAVTGWKKLGGYWYYFAKADDYYNFREGAMYDEGQMKVNGKWYYFGWWDGPSAKWGKMQTGWITVTGTYTDENGEEVTYKLCYYADPAKDSQLAQGWNKINGSWYYFAKENNDEEYDIGLMYAQGPMTVNGKYYYFPTWENPSKWGKLQSGWIKESNSYTYEYEDGTVITETYTNWYYGDPANDSQLAVGWKKIDGKWYYFVKDWNCEMVANDTRKIGGKLYAFNRNGSLHEVQGWVDLYEEWTENGKKMKESYWVYTDAKGIAKTGWQKISGEWYLFDEWGYMEYNTWATDKTGTMWLGTNGKIVKSQWKKIDGEWYYLKASGYRAANEWAKDSKGWMYMGEDGIALKLQFLEYKGHTFFLKEDGYMACNEWIMWGHDYWYFDENGYGTL